MKTIKILFVILFAAISHGVVAQVYETNITVQTFAGSGFYGYLDGVGTQTMFHDPASIVADSQGNLFVGDGVNLRIRQIAPDATLSPFVGGGTQLPAIGTNAALVIGNMAIDRHDTIWMIQPSGYYYYGPESALYEITKSAITTREDLLISPAGICVDPSGNVYLSDPNAQKIYRYATNGLIEVFVGSGNPSYADGNGIFTAFNGPQCLAADSAGNIYVFDANNHMIRKINQNRDVTTLAGYNSVYYYYRAMHLIPLTSTGSGWRWPTILKTCWNSMISFATRRPAAATW
ncbi:MAG: hypothetical protein JWQ04_3287, partial [Pedosphaera sp.]|nr:hypothetical protein [Pedosphaera sp.]